MPEAKKTEKQVENAVTLIPIYIPLLPDDDGVTEVDQRITVTVNGVNRILLRGQTIEVTPEEYEALYNSQRFDRL